MSARRKRELGEAIAQKLTSSDLNFIRDWRTTARELLTLMHTMDERELEALYTVVGLFWYTKKSRIVLLSYLTSPEHADQTWNTIFSISTYSGWILEEDENHYNALAESRYDLLTYMLRTLRSEHGIEADSDGRIPSLMAHIKVRAAYKETDSSDVPYEHHPEAVRFVEENYERVDEVIRYGAACGYLGMSKSDFEEFLEHHSAVQEGWL